MCVVSFWLDDRIVDVSSLLICYNWESLVFAELSAWNLPYFANRGAQFNHNFDVLFVIFFPHKTTEDLGVWPQDPVVNFPIYSINNAGKYAVLSPLDSRIATIHTFLPLSFSYLKCPWWSFFIDGKLFPLLSTGVTQYKYFAIVYQFRDATKNQTQHNWSVSLHHLHILGSSHYQVFILGGYWQRDHYYCEGWCSTEMFPWFSFLGCFEESPRYWAVFFRYVET